MPVRGLRPPILALSAIASFALAAPASAEVEPGRNLEINHSIEFGVFENWSDAQDIRIDVMRGATLIATKTGRPEDNGRGGTIFEANHVGGADCWAGVPAGRTPDVKPGDKIVVTVLDALGAPTADVDYTFVRNIAFVENADGSVTGHARGAETAPGVFDLNAPLDTVDNIMEAKRVLAPETADYAFSPADFGLNGTFTNVQVGGTPGAGELFIDYLDGSGGGTGNTVTFPAEEDGPCGPKLTTGLTSSSHSVINIANAGGDLVVGGPRDGTSTVTGLTFGGTAYTADNSASDAWTATIPAADLAALANNADHELVVSFSDGSPDATRTIRKDVTAPVLAASLAPGTYTGARSVALSSDGAEDVRYTVDGSLPTASSRVYDGTPLALGVGTHTIRAFSTDAAGNRTDTTYSYTIEAVPAPAEETKPEPEPRVVEVPVVVPGPAPAPVTAAVEPLRALALNGLSARRALSLREARRGIRVNAQLPAGAEVVRVRLVRVSGGRRTVVHRSVRLTPGGPAMRLTIGGAALRRKLRAGSYVIEVTPGASRSSLGTPSVRRITIRR